MSTAKTSPSDEEMNKLASLCASPILLASSRRVPNDFFFSRCISVLRNDSMGSSEGGAEQRKRGVWVDGNKHEFHLPSNRMWRPQNIP